MPAREWIAIGPPLFIAGLAIGGVIELWAIRKAARDELPRRWMFLLPGRLRAEAGERHRARMTAPDQWTPPVGHEPCPVGGLWFCLHCNQQLHVDEHGFWATGGPDARATYCAERASREVG
jgi:hypothetical protein